MYVPFQMSKLVHVGSSREITDEKSYSSLSSLLSLYAQRMLFTGAFSQPQNNEKCSSDTGIRPFSELNFQTVML